MDKQKLFVAAGIALAQKMHKEAAIQCQGESSMDKKLLSEEGKLNEGGTPAAATTATNASDSSTFDTKKNNTLPSGSAEGSTVDDNADMTPRNKTASLSGLLDKAASADLAHKGDTGLEAESHKQVGEGGTGDVTNGAESDANPDPVKTGGAHSNPGDENMDMTPRTQKTASDILALLKR